MQLRLICIQLWRGTWASPQYQKPANRDRCSSGNAEIQNLYVAARLCGFRWQFAARGLLVLRNFRLSGSGGRGVAGQLMSQLLKSGRGGPVHAARSRPIASSDLVRKDSRPSTAYGPSSSRSSLSNSFTLPCSREGAKASRECWHAINSDTLCVSGAEMKVSENSISTCFFQADHSEVFRWRPNGSPVAIGIHLTKNSTHSARQGGSCASSPETTAKA